jgi:RimJ/RimL family protein N-acetyltransferase
VLTGERVVLRAQNRKDVEEQHTQMAGDYAIHAVMDASAWQPDGLEAALARYDKTLAEPVDPKNAWFTVARRDDPELTWRGRAGLWEIDEYQSTAHVGLMLAESARGQGLGTDSVRVICDYAFRIRGLHRITLETLATNQPMLHAARSAGFIEEGRMREHAYVLGDRVDELQLGLLRSEWKAAADGPP